MLQLGMNEFKRLTVSILEYIVGGFMILGGFATGLGEPLASSGTFSAIFGGQIALIVYGVIFVLVGAVLIYSKIACRRKVHGLALLSIYLICLFVFLLEWALVGFTLHLLDQVIVGLLAAVFWLRWKLMTEYIDIKQFHHDLDVLECPPDKP